MEISIINHTINNTNYGINLEGIETDNIVYFSKDSAAFVHLPKTLFNINYQRRPIKNDELKEWISFINNNKDKYLEVNYHKCYELLVSLINKLRHTLIEHNSIRINNNEICPLCISEYFIGDKMISFHTHHQKHVCCLDCYNKYSQVVCDGDELNNDNLRKNKYQRRHDIRRHGPESMRCKFTTCPICRQDIDI